MEKHLWMCFCSRVLASCQQEEMSMSRQGTLNCTCRLQLQEMKMSARQCNCEEWEFSNLG